MPQTQSLYSICQQPVTVDRVDKCLALQANTLAARAVGVAEAQNSIAGASLMVAILGTFFLLWTLRLGRQQTAAAIAAADEARRANRFAAEQAISDARPWMLMKRWETRRVYALNRRELGPPDGQAFQIEWSNSGQSPALLKSRGERLLVYRPGDPDPSFGKIELNEAVASIAAGDTFLSAELEIRDVDYLHFAAGNAALFMRCVCVYAHPTRPESEYRSELTVRFLITNQKREDNTLVPAVQGFQWGTDNVFT